MAGRVGELFERNGGVATRAELIEFGYTPAQIRRFLADGLLIVKRHGVYALATHEAMAPRDQPRVEARRLAAVLARATAGFVGSHETAALIHGLDILDRPAVPGQTSVVPVTLTHAGRGVSRNTGREGVRIHAADLPDGDVVRRCGVPVTSVARTVLDLSRGGTFLAGVIVADSALHGGQVTKAALTAGLARMRRWPGLRRARSVVAFSDERAESPLESLARVVFREHGVPPPELQVWIHDDYGGRIARVDFLWPRERVVGEADGKIKYKQHAVTAEQQLERDKKIRGARYEPVHFGWADAMYETGDLISEFTIALQRGAQAAG